MIFTELDQILDDFQDGVRCPTRLVARRRVRSTLNIYYIYIYMYVYMYIYIYIYIHIYIYSRVCRLLLRGIVARQRLAAGLG